jgi:iron complex transport system permease protein
MNQVAGVSNASPVLRAWRLPAVLGLLTLLLAVHTLSMRLPFTQWAGVLTGFADPSNATLAQRVVQYSWLPRLAISLLAGAALSLAGVVFQQVLRNPLAEPLTLGVSAGAYLALTVAAIWAPMLVADARFTIALAGAALAMLSTMALSWRKGFAAVSVVLAGMVVNLYCGAIAVLLTVAYERSLTAVFIWGGGSLAQNGWHAVLWMLPRVGVCALGVLLLVRPLTLFSLDDRSASQLGLSLAWARPAALALAVVLCAFVTSAVGVIGFVGLAGPALARLAGARRLRDRLLWAPPTGAALLALTDQAVQCLPGVVGEQLPAGAAIALLGGPLLLWLLRRLHVDGARPAAPDAVPARRAVLPVALLLAALLLVSIIVSLRFAHTLGGWHWTSSTEWAGVAFWRVPRLVASAAAGVMVALSGTLLQRVTGNPMASPELLGVSGGAMLGVLAAAVLTPAPSATALLVAAAIGALCFLLAMLALVRRSRYAPGHVLLAGVSLFLLSQSAISLATANGGAYASLLRTMMYGSTYLIGPSSAAIVSLCALVAVVAVLLCARWLDILPLGADVADALGVGTSRARLTLLVIAAILTAAATTVLGPMSFVGLMAPHLARLCGFTSARAQMLIAALLGALLMVFADWLGRNLIFPQQMPAGVLATLIGGPWLMWLLRRR